MRRLILAAAILVLLLPVSNAFAGRIFGDIKMDGKPVPEGIRVKITAPLPAETGKTEAAKPKPVVIADSTATDKFGSYKLTVKDEGKCVLTVVIDKQPVALEVFSYKEATRYDLILEKKEGKLSLRRK